MKIKFLTDPLASDNNCYNNCLQKVSRDGGKVVVGWRRSVATTKGALMAVLDHHAVWESPQGEMFDITPRIVIAEGSVRRVIDEEIEFEIDESAEFHDSRAQPSKYVPNVEDAFGLLKKACEWANKAQAATSANDQAKADYANKKVHDFLNQHWKRSRR